MEDGEGNSLQHSGTRRTRSQAAPDWPLEHALILVNEIAAVEMDCSNAFSSFQKWKMVVENCNALGVPRSLDQCRRKWDSLLGQYNKIRQWESKSRSNSYWSLRVERRKVCGLPEDFDKELFKAIDTVARTKDGESGTDRDSDPEAQEDPHEVMEELELSGSKKQRRNLMLLNSHAEVKPKNCFAMEEPVKHVAENAQRGRAKEKLHAIERKEKHQASKEDNPQKSHAEERRMISVEERERMMVAKLNEDAKEIHAIVEKSLGENSDYRGTDLNKVDHFQGESIRHQADKLIGCLGNILSTLNHFSQLAEDEEHE
ncbi:hypothetical protein SLA2020_398170 [Shorea laevis]